MEESHFGIKYKTEDIEFEGGKIKTYAFGNGDIKILMLPGYPTSGFFYIWLVRFFDLTKYTFITLDFPGWAGLSDNIYKRKKHSIENYVDIVGLVIKEYKLDSFNLIGYSFGGAIAVKIAALFEDRIKKVILISPVYSGKLLKRNYRIRLMQLAKHLNLQKIFHLVFIGKFKSVVKHELSGKVSDTDLQKVLEALEQTDGKIILNDAYELFQTDWSDYLKDLSPEKLFLMYSKNEVGYFRQQASLLKETFGNSIKFYELEGLHEDALLKPSQNTVNEIIKFLQGSN